MKNRIRIILIMIVAAVILTNYERAAVGTVIGIDRIINKGRTYDYKYIKLSYEESVPQEYVEEVYKEIPRLPTEIITKIIENDIEIRICDIREQEEGLVSREEKTIRININDGPQNIRPRILEWMKGAKL